MGSKSMIIWLLCEAPICSSEEPVQAARIDEREVLRTGGAGGGGRSTTGAQSVTGVTGAEGTFDLGEAISTSSEMPWK